MQMGQILALNRKRTVKLRTCNYFGIESDLDFIQVVYFQKLLLFSNNSKMKFYMAAGRISK